MPIFPEAHKNKNKYLKLVLSDEDKLHNERIKNARARLDQFKQDLNTAEKLEGDALKRLESSVKTIFGTDNIIGQRLLSDPEKTQEDLARLDGNLKGLQSSLDATSSISDLTSSELKFLLTSFERQADGVDELSKAYGLGKVGTDEYNAALQRLKITSTTLTDLLNLEARARGNLAQKNQLALENIKLGLSPSKMLQKIRKESLQLSEKELAVTEAKLAVDQAEQQLLTTSLTDPKRQERIDAVTAAKALRTKAIADLELLEKTQKTTFQLAQAGVDAFTNSLSSGLNGLVRGTMTVKDAFKSMANSILDSLAKVASNKLAEMLFQGLMSFTPASFQKFMGTGTGTGSGEIPFSQFQLNNPSPVAITRYGSAKIADEFRYGGMSIGGIARGPQAGYPAILHGNEAVVPLPSGDKIPVELKGGMSGDVNNISINITTEGNTSMTQTGQGNPGEQGQALAKVIAATVQKELVHQKRPGGILSPLGVA